MVKKNVAGRNYIKKKPEKRRCEICGEPYETTHPKQKSCLKSKCQDVLKQKNYDAFIAREFRKLQERDAIKLAQDTLVALAMKQAERIIAEKEQGHGKHKS